MYVVNFRACAAFRSADYAHLVCARCAGVVHENLSPCAANIATEMVRSYAMITMVIKDLYIAQRNVHGTGSSIAIIGFAIWPDLTRTQLLP